MNITEIAKLAGVSPASVSRYFNHGYISQEKKDRIEKIVQETGYQPSVQAQTLRTKKTKLIGVILPKINSDSVARVVAGISQVLSESEYQILLANTDNSPKKEVEYLKIFSNKQVDGIILIATIFTKEHKGILKELTVPVVLVGQRMNGFSCVYHDDYQAAYELTKVMLRSCPSKIGYIGVTQEDIAVGVSRQQGFQDAVREQKIEAHNVEQVESRFSMESGYESAKNLFGKCPDIEALFCVTDSIAIGAMRYLKELGKKIPDDVVLVGMGNSKMGTVTTPTVTTVHLYYKTSGIEAARLLIEKINDVHATNKEIKMGYNIIEQESTFA